MTIETPIKRPHEQEQQNLIKIKDQGIHDDPDESENFTVRGCAMILHGFGGRFERTIAQAVHTWCKDL